MVCTQATFCIYIYPIHGYKLWSMTVSPHLAHIQALVPKETAVRSSSQLTVRKAEAPYLPWPHNTLACSQSRYNGHRGARRYLWRERRDTALCLVVSAVVMQTPHSLRHVGFIYVRLLTSSVLHHWCIAIWHDDGCFCPFRTLLMKWRDFIMDYVCSIYGTVHLYKSNEDFVCQRS